MNDMPMPETRLCQLCNRRPTAKGHDACIANLPGVAYACCGHGETEGYVCFENGLTIRGRFDHVRRALSGKGMVSASIRPGGNGGCQ